MENKVINFSEGSKLYFELGNYYYYKNNMDKALNYYERALAVDPANPVNHFNLACLLSELGNYKKSTAIFKRIVEMDSNLSESWFWLALNSGQQQQYREASQYLRKYLEREPEGDYSWQAEEILDYLRSDLPMLSPGQREKIEELCAEGVEFVNKGRLQEAIQCFSRASDIEPGLSAPQNNLALSWFHAGEIGKAIEVTMEILEREPQNLFANCNLAVFAKIINDQLTVRRQIQILDGLWSDIPEEMLKLGTTFGLLGQDRRAMYLFWSLRESCPSYEVLLLMGISAYNCGYLSAAAKVFERANRMEPESPYAVYRQMCQGGSKGKLPYHLRIPNETIACILEGKSGPGELKVLREDRDLWPQMLWVIKHCSAGARHNLCDIVLDSGSKALIAKLQAMVWQPGMGGWQRDIYTCLDVRGIVPWKQHNWNKGLMSAGAAAVLEGAMQILDKMGYGYYALALVHECWTAYWLNQRPPIRNIQLWIAALMVFVQGLEELECTAREFDIDPANLARAVKKLTVCI